MVQPLQYYRTQCLSRFCFIARFSLKRMSVTFNIVICQWSVSIRCPLETTTSEEHAPPNP